MSMVRSGSGVVCGGLLSLYLGLHEPPALFACKSTVHALDG